jgi:hypothetical protein
VFDEGGDAVLFAAIEVGVFKEGKVSGSADSSYLLQNAEGVLAELFEFFAGGLRKHGANYINLERADNSTLVLRKMSGGKGRNYRLAQKTLQWIKA